jgi:hypothetical protein
MHCTVYHVPCTVYRTSPRALYLPQTAQWLSAVAPRRFSKGWDGRMTAMATGMWRQRQRQQQQQQPGREQPRLALPEYEMGQTTDSMYKYVYGVAFYAVLYNLILISIRQMSGVYA